jgi:DNA-binding NarL/FixJ family response regulator
MAQKRIGNSKRNGSSASKRLPAAIDDRTSVENRIRIVIADDDPMILDQIGLLLETDFDVVGRASDGRALVEMVKRLSPSVVVTDITMPELNGIEAAKKIAKTYPNVKIVMLSIHEDQYIVDAAFEAGASGYVLKLSASTELIPAIKKVLAGRRYRPRLVT